jgi:hypothetical protein
MYPMSFEINPIDRFKHHTWHVHLPKISVSSLRKAIGNTEESGIDSV